MRRRRLAVLRAMRLEAEGPMMQMAWNTRSARSGARFASE